MKKQREYKIMKGMVHLMTVMFLLANGKKLKKDTTKSGALKKIRGKALKGIYKGNVW